MRRSCSARYLAGAFLLAMGAATVAGAEQLRLAAERPDGACPADSKVLGIARLGAPLPPGSDPSRCVFLASLAGLSDGEMDAAVGLLAPIRSAAGLMLSLPPASDMERTGYAVKRLASIFHSGSPDGRVALYVDRPLSADAAEELAPYLEALVVRAGHAAAPDSAQRTWAIAPLTTTGSAADAVVRTVSELPRATLAVVLADTRPLSAGDLDGLARLERYLTADASPDPTRTPVTHKDGSRGDALRFFDAKSFAPTLLLAEDPSGEARVELSGGPYDRASVENLASGARRDFELKGAPVLTLDLSKGPLAVVLKPRARPGGDNKAAVEVGAIRGLTADEIIAHERAWDAGQREKVEAYTAVLDTSLRFRVAEFQTSLDLTIRGPLFAPRGKPPDWAFQEFFLNGVKWKGRTIPKLPILQPEKVTTLPLDIRLSEEYEYTLAGETSADGRAAYRIDFRPREAGGDKPLYRGTVWIDQETFALLRRASIQLNLKGDTLSNVQTEYYRAVASRPDVILPLEIRGEQVFSTVGRVTAIERRLLMTDVQINPSDFQARLQEAYSSKLQMVRDTDEGLRYLVPEPSDPTRRVVEKSITRHSLFGLAGAFYQRSSDYPLPLLGLQYFDFDLFGKEKQLSVFFAGVLLFANYTDPSFLGTRTDLGVDLFGQAIPFSEQDYRGGDEVVSERIKHLTEFGQVNLGIPIGPYLKTSLGVFTQWDNFQRDPDTGPAFVTPVDTLTNGAELRLSWNQDGYNLVAKGSYSARAKWEPWGDPETSGFDPDQKTYWKYSAVLSKGFYFSHYRKLGVSVSYLDGRRLDRFSQWDFGPFGSSKLAGFPSGSVRADRAVLANLSYGLNIENIVRFEVSYDQALITQTLSGYDHTYFSGAGLETSFNGPWDNTRIRAEVGYPVVAHGVKGLTLNLNFLKLF
ncbi:MAG: hypothetical protein ABI968_10520 [Acidobacteriota bacterium]